MQIIKKILIGEVFPAIALNISIEANIVDPDQTAHTLFVYEASNI